MNYKVCKDKIDNFDCPHEQKTLIKKHACHSVSVPYLQKRLKLSAKETEQLLSEWRSLNTASEMYDRKFDEIRKYLKPPRFKNPRESMTELQIKKENRTLNAIRFLESIGYKVEKKWK